MTRTRADEVRLALPSHPKYLPLVRAAAEEGARVAGFDVDTQKQIALAVTEGLTNVMRHGYCGATDRPIDVVIRAPPGTCIIEIHDDGAFVDPDCMQSRSLDEVRPGGLGVHLMKATMDDVAWMPNENGGTTLRLEKRLPPPAAAEEGK